MRQSILTLIAKLLNMRGSAYMLADRCVVRLNSAEEQLRSL